MNESTTVDQTVQANFSELPQNSASPMGHQGTQCESESGVDQPILFFDGICGLCNTSVDFVLARDKKCRLLYSPLQGETAKRLLSEKEIHNVDTVVLRPAEGMPLYRRSAAIVRLCWLMGFPWNLLGCMLWCIPLPIRDLGYRIVAGSRYRLFGKHETCRMPTPEERARFLP